MKNTQIANPVSQIPPIENNFFIKELKKNEQTDKKPIVNILEQWENTMETWHLDKFHAFFQATEYLLSADGYSEYQKNFVTSQRYAMKIVLNKLYDKLQPLITREKISLPKKTRNDIITYIYYFKDILQARGKDLEILRMKYIDDQDKQKEYLKIQDEFNYNLSMIEQIVTLWGNTAESKSKS
jgi:hypothetical protein